MRRWLMLALGTAAQTAACVFVYGIPYLAPELRGSADLSLAQVGVLVACPTAGLVLALVAWGAAADRYGERVVISLGLGLAAAALACAVPLAMEGRHGLTALGGLFAVAGAAAASVYAASGRLVLGWFSARERGLAMGLRQTSTPLGMGIAALLVPPLAERWGVTGAVVLFAATLGVNALLVAVLVTDPPRPPARTAKREATEPETAKHEAAGHEAAEPKAAGKAAVPEAAEPEAARQGAGARAANPYRTPVLWRIHSASALLVVPQFTFSAFALLFLIDVRHWDPVHAGRLLAGAQALGAVSRIAAGRWSDHVEGRLRPMRQLAVAITGVVALAAAGAVWPTWASDVVLVIACAITASTNGLAYTATAELAGPTWTGRVLGVQNTGQNLTAAVAPPLIGALITATGYGYAFAAAAAFAATASLVIPASMGSGGPGGSGVSRGSRGSGGAGGSKGPGRRGAGDTAASAGAPDRRVTP